MTQALALETVNYVMKCLHANERDLAESAVLEQDNGLSKEQRDAIHKLIQERGEGIKPGLAQVRFDNRLLGVVQPATLEVMTTPAVLAQLHHFLEDYRVVPREAIFMVQTEHTYSARQAVRDHIERIGQERSWETWDRISLSGLMHTNHRNKANFKQTLALFPNLRTIMVDTEHAWGLEEIAQLLPKTCPQFTTLKLEHAPFFHVLEPFKKCVKELKLNLTVKPENIRDLLTYPKLEALEFSKVTRELLDEVAMLPIKRLKINEGSTVGSMASIANLAKWPQLERLEVCKCPMNEIQELMDLLQANGNLSEAKITEMLGGRPLSECTTLVQERAFRGEGELTFDLSLSKKSPEDHLCVIEYLE